MDFTTSQLSTDGNPIRNNMRQSNIRNNTLVVVVTKAHGLRNVLRYDKQSPFITIRIQDQEESTKVVPRGGQNPEFNNELWFNLDGIEEKTMYINAYHQSKNDAKLICSGEVDFSLALKRSTTDGYDGWFDVYYQGRESGRIYLEMTYYPSKGVVPIGTESAGRVKMSKSSSQLPLSAMLHSNNSASFNNTLRDKNRMYKQTDADNIPELGELKIGDSSPTRGKINKFTNFEKRFNNSTSSSPTKSEMSKPSLEIFTQSESQSPVSSVLDNTEQANNGGSNWLSFLDTPIKFSLLNGITFNGHTTGSTSTNKFEKKAYDINDAIEHKVKLKVESPNLFKERPKKLFTSDDEDEEEEQNNKPEFPNKFRDMSVNVTDKWKKSIASRQEPIYRETGLTVSSLPFKRDDIVKSESDDDDYSEDEYSYGQIVNFKDSVRSRSTMNTGSEKPVLPNLRLDEEEMRNSYKGRKLPPVKTVSPPIPNLSDTSSEELDMDELDDVLQPPPPPKHIISMGSLFDKSVSTIPSPTEKFVLHKTPSSELPQTAPVSDNNGLSWYDRRKQERRRQSRILG